MLKQNARTTIDAELSAPAKCCHHWVIQVPNGPFSQGECQKCQEVRHFQNFIEMSDWGDKKHPQRAEIEPLPTPEDIEFLGFYLEDFNPVIDRDAEETAATG